MNEAEILVEVRRWLQFARDDLYLAERILEDPASRRRDEGSPRPKADP